MAYNYCQGPIDSCPSLYYDQDLNRFIDDAGEILNDMHEILEPWQIKHLKTMGKESGYCVLGLRDGGIIEVFFPCPWSDHIFWDMQREQYMEQSEYYDYAIGIHE